MANSLRELLERGSGQLDAVSDSPRLDAEVLLSHSLDVNRAYLRAHPEQEIMGKPQQDYEQLLARRQAGEPVAHLTGKSEFWSLDLAITPDTLIPRPETEHLVEQVLELLPTDANWRIADLGTGSGAIAIAIAHERPRCQVIAFDLSVAALEVAEHNRKQLGLNNIEFRHSNWFSAMAENEQFHIIAANPPYIAEQDEHLEQGDVRFDPRFALTSGADGLDAIRLIIATAPAHLAVGGWLLLEHGYDQGDAVAALFRQSDFTEVNSHKDLAGQPRLTMGRLTANFAARDHGE
jgi:release factor glutamine methyltransferase